VLRDTAVQTLLFASACSAKCVQPVSKVCGRAATGRQVAGQEPACCLLSLPVALPAANDKSVTLPLLPPSAGACWSCGGPQQQTDAFLPSAVTKCTLKNSHFQL